MVKVDAVEATAVIPIKKNIDNSPINLMVTKERSHGVVR